MLKVDFSEYNKKYEEVGKISEGNFAKVYKIRNIQTQQFFALKKITIKKSKDKTNYLDVQNELMILSKFKHPHIVKAFEYYEIQIKNAFGKEQTEIGIVLELAKCTLQHMIKNRISLGNQKSLVQQIVGLVGALEYLQQQNMAHRDIKPANILIFTHQCGYNWKLTDFGLSINVKNKQENQPFAGTVEYASPRLKMKYNFHNNNIKTNSFKDDVFSLGLTLLQILTGNKIYNRHVSNSIQKMCDKKIIVDLLDMMLREEEEERPCFKRLKLAIKRDYNEYVENFDERKQKQGKQIKLNYPEKYLQKSDGKTIVKKDQFNIKFNIFNVSKSIQSISEIDGKIMCGCDSGQVIFMDQNDVVNVRNVHKKYISAMNEDKDGNIWSAGGDGCLIKWNKSKLLKGLLNDVKVHEVKERNIFKKNSDLKIKKEFVLEIDNTVVQKKFESNNGISCFAIMNDNFFAVGFYNGGILIRYGQEQFKYEVHHGPVTDIKINELKNQVISCGVDGYIKCFSLNQRQLWQRFYESKVLIVGVSVENDGKSIIVVNENGKITFLDHELNIQNESKVDCQNIFSCTFEPNNCFLLSEDGYLIDGREENKIEIGKKGWNCMKLRGSRQLVAASFQGWVAILQY